MRAVFALMVALAAGCTDGAAPPNLTNDDSGVGDMADEDMPVTMDLRGEVDMLPQGCRTACDCPAGQACVSSVCTASNPPTFCCGTAACTGADFCQTPDGRFSQCSAPADAGIRDAGSSSSCMMTPCTPGLGSQLFCSLACGSLTAMCSGATNHCTP